MTYKDLLAHFQDDPEVYQNLQMAIASTEWRDVEDTHLCRVLVRAFDLSKVPPGIGYWGKICVELAKKNL